MKMHTIRAALLSFGIALSASLAPVCFAQGSLQSGSLPLLSLNYQQRPPDWAVGRFEGTNRFYHFDIYLTISGFGNITGTIRDDDGSRDSFSGRFNDGYVRIRGRRYNIEQIFRGIRLTDESDSRNTANLSKMSGTGGYDTPGGGGSGGGGSVSRPPDWARGTFSGHNDKYNADIQLSIASSGNVTETVRDEKGKTYTYRGTWRDGRVTLNRNTFDIRRERDGVRMTQVGERTNTVYLDRRGGDDGDDSDSGGSGSRPPDWALGTFSGYNDKYRAEIELNITSSGSVTERVRDENGKTYTYRGNWRDGRVRLDNKDFDIRRERDGVRMTQVGERTNTVYLDRGGSSGGGSDMGERPPSWMVGTFQGYNDKYNSDIELTVNSSGRVTQRITQDDGKKYTVSGYWRDELITLDNNDFEIRREGSGIRMTQVGERSNTVLLRRR